MRKTARGPLIA
uniref:Uncharacterized protein n=1 Tax=Arundo donax TaxID=35708 RepID=A0A0A9EPU0_ARUDO